MIYDFTYYNPTKIYFGKNSLSNLEKELNAYGKNVLLLYGKGSIKKIGLYDSAKEILAKCDKNVVGEFCDIKINSVNGISLYGDLV